MAAMTNAAGCFVGLSRARALNRRLCLLASALLLFAGESGAQLQVKPNGSVGYDVPLAVPPGVAGMAPKLGLSYSSSEANGPLGQGWQLNGVSAITRCPGTIATDGRKSGVAFGPDDKLCLDGERLIQTDAAGAPKAFPQAGDAAGLASGAYKEYRTARDSFVRVRAYGTASLVFSPSTAADSKTGPSWFRVWTKSGQILDFGAAPSADANSSGLIAASEGTNVYTRVPVAMAWALVRASDVAGNFVDYKYEQREVKWGSGMLIYGPPLDQLEPGREWNLKEVQYSAAKVIFSYLTDDSRPDKAEAYQNRNKVVRIRRLSSITTYINSPNTAALGPASGAVAVKTYKLNYEVAPNTKRSRLSAIQECAGGALSTKCLPATSFKYSNGGDDSFVAEPDFNLALLPMQSTTGKYGVLVADFDGDGRTDILRWSDTPAENALYISRGDGAFVADASFNIKDQNLFKSDGCYISIVGDFNGDGLPDILRYSSAKNSSGFTCTTFSNNRLYVNKGDGSFATQTISVPLLRAAITDTADGAIFYVIDINGDGILDLLTTLADKATNSQCSNSICTRIYLGSTSGAFSELTGSNVAAMSLFTSPAQGYNANAAQLSNMGDFNGDGLVDIAVAASYYLSRGDGNFDPVTSGLVCSPFSQYPEISIDYNGDGRSDCLVRAVSPASNYLKYADTFGASAYSLQATFNLKSAGHELAGTDIGVIAADFDGDGFQDILRWEGDATKNILFASNGDGTFTASTTFNLNTAFTRLSKDDGSYATILGDFTGRGHVEMLRVVSDPKTGAATSNQLYTRVNSTSPDLMVETANGLGAKQTVTYVSLANSAGRYVSDRSTQFAASGALVDVAIPIYVASTVQMDSGVGSTRVAEEFSYFGQKIDRFGGGLLGFREIRTQRVAPDGSLMTTVTSYSQAFPYVGRAESQRVYKAGMNSLSGVPALSQSDLLYCDALSAASPADAVTNGESCPKGSNKIVQPYLLYSKTSGQDLDGSQLPTSTRQFTINKSGVVTQAVETTTGTVAGAQQQFVTKSVNTPLTDDTACTAVDACRWLIGRISSNSVTKTVPTVMLPTSAGTAPNAAATKGTLVISP